MRTGVLSLLLAAPLLFGGASPVLAQPPTLPAAPPSDVIGSLLDRSVPPPKDNGEPGLPASAPPPSYAAAPAHIDDIGKTPDRPPSVRDMAYDARLRASFASAESFQGPLEGGWALTADGQDLYALQLVDRRDRLEGVWRDIRRKGSLNASGLVDDLRRQGSDLTLRFAPSPGAASSVATLHDSGDGLWVGELVEAGGRKAVTLRRTGP